MKAAGRLQCTEPRPPSGASSTPTTKAPRASGWRNTARAPSALASTPQRPDSTSKKVKPPRRSRSRQSGKEHPERHDRPRAARRRGRKADEDRRQIVSGSEIDERCNDDDRDREKEKDPKERAHITPRRVLITARAGHSDRAASRQPVGRNGAPARLMEATPGRGDLETGTASGSRGL